MSSVKFEDFSIEVQDALDSSIIAGLYEAAGELQSQVVRNTRVDSGQTANSWDYIVEEGEKKATIGNPLENAIWEEFGTGEYALNGDGRKGGWYVPAEKLTTKAKSKMQKREVNKKEYYFTRGKTPSRAFHNAITSTKPKISNIFERKLSGGMK